MKILITGASRGIGKKLYNYFKLNHEVYTISRSPGKTKNDFSSDLSDIKDLKEISRKINRLDVIINNAAITFYSKDKIENFEKIIQTNLNAPYFVSSIFLKQLKKSKIKSIINISSINAFQGFENNPGYVASKSGLVGLTRALAIDYKKYKIRVNCVSPGFFKDGGMTMKSYKNKKRRKKISDRTILKRWGSSKDIFGIIEYLMSNRSSYVTGQNFIIDGGWLAQGI